MTRREGGPGRCAVFLDRDGTITHDVHYCRRPEDLLLLPGAAEAIAALNRAGVPVVVVTNQSAVARGYVSLEDLGVMHRKMREDLARAAARIDAIYFCPHRPEDACDCRKPRTALFARAAQDLGVSLARSYMIGDKAADIAAGRAIGGTTVLVKTGQWTGPEAGVMPDFEAVDLREAADWILERERRRPGFVAVGRAARTGRGRT